MRWLDANIRDALGVRQDHAMQEGTLPPVLDTRNRAPDVSSLKHTLTEFSKVLRAELTRLEGEVAFINKSGNRSLIFFDPHHEDNTREICQTLSCFMQAYHNMVQRHYENVDALLIQGVLPLFSHPANLKFEGDPSYAAHICICYVLSMSWLVAVTAMLG